MADSSKRREGKARSRWLWGLLAGVVLVAIAAVFWIDEASVLPPVSRGTTPVAPAPAPASTAQNAAPSAPSSPSPPASPPAPTAPSPEKPAAPSAVAQEPSPPPALAPGAEPPLPPPAPGRESQEVAGIYAPKSLAQLVGTWAYSAADCERLFQRRGGGWAYREPVDKFAQAAIVESPKKILLPSAICRIDGAREAEGMLKVSADCEDSISFTSRSVMIALRSTTELVYSASGDAALATTLKKCAP
jgi:hypothetical protein